MILQLEGPIWSDKLHQLKDGINYNQSIELKTGQQFGTYMKEIFKENNFKILDMKWVPDAWKDNFQCEYLVEKGIKFITTVIYSFSRNTLVVSAFEEVNYNKLPVN